MTVELKPQNDTETRALTALETAQGLAIVTVEDRQTAEDEVVYLKALEDEITRTYAPRIKAAHELHKGLLADQNKALVPVNDARRLIKSKCITWDQEQERIRRKEESRLQAEARRQAEEEAMQAALEAEAEGEVEVAQAIIDAPVIAPKVTVQRMGPAPSRLTAGRSAWSAVCVDPAAFVKAAAAGNSIALAALTNDAAKKYIAKQMGSIVRAQKQSFSVPGVRAVESRV